MAWIDNTSILLTHRCLISFSCGIYSDFIIRDIIPMKITHILLGRPWLFDQNVKHYGRENTYDLMVGKKEVVLKPMTLAEMNKFKESKPKVVEGKKKRDLENNIKLLHVLTKKNFQVESHKAGVVFVVIAQQVREPTVGCDVGIPLEVSTLLSEFSDVAPGDLPNELPPLRSIQHAIDLVSGSQLPNLPAYRNNPNEHAELKKHVKKLLSKGFIRESLSLVLFQLCLRLKLMVLGTYVLIVMSLTRLQSSIDSQFLNLTIC